VKNNKINLQLCVEDLGTRPVNAQWSWWCSPLHHTVHWWISCGQWLLSMHLPFVVVKEEWSYATTLCGH